MPNFLLNINNQYSRQRVLLVSLIGSAGLLIRIVLPLGVFLCWSSLSQAQSHYFAPGGVFTGTGDWSNPANWSSTPAPTFTAAGSVPISGAAPTYSGGNDVVISTGTICQIPAAGANCRNITVDGTLNVTNTGGNRTLFVAQNFINKGTVNTTSGTNVLDFTIGGNFTLTNGAFNAGTSSITVGGAFTDSAVATFTAGTSTVRFNGTTSGAQVSMLAPDRFHHVEVAKDNASIRISSSITIAGNLTFNSLPVPPAVSVFSMLFDTPGAAMTVQGNLTVNSGGIDMSLQDNTFLTVNGSTTVNGGRVLIARSTTNSILTLNNGLRILDGSLEVGTSTVTAQSRLRVNGNTFMQKGLLLINASTAEFFGNVQLVSTVGSPSFSPYSSNIIVTGSWSNDNPNFFVRAASTVTFFGSSATFINGQNHFANVIILKDANITVTNQSDLSIERDLNIQQGALVLRNIPGTDMLLDGNLTIANNASLDLSDAVSDPASRAQIEVSGNLTDLNDQEPSTSPRRGLYIGMNQANPMGERGCTSGSYTVDPVQTLPTITFTGNKNQIITGYVKLRTYCNGIYSNEDPGIALPNVVVNKVPVSGVPSIVQLNTNTNVRVHGDFTLTNGEFLLNSRAIWFGDHQDDEIRINGNGLTGAAFSGGIFHANLGSRIFMNTGTTYNGTFLIVNGGALKLIGSSNKPVVITREGTPNQYYRMAAYRGTVEAIYTTISYQGGAGANTTFATDPNEPDAVKDWHTNGSNGGFKIYSRAIIDPYDLGYNFSYCVLGANAAGGTTSLTINTGQELNIVGTIFNTSGTGGINVSNNNNLATAKTLTFVRSSGELGGVNGEPNDAGYSDTDGILWENYNRIYWLGGNNTSWSNPLNWSLRNDAYDNPHSIYPGQMTSIPAIYGGGSRKDTLQKFEVFICASAPNSPVIDVDSIIIQGTLINNAVGQNNRFDISPVGTRSGKNLNINGKILGVWGDFVNNNRDAAGDNLGGSTATITVGTGGVIKFRANLASFHAGSTIAGNSTFKLEAQGGASLQEIKIANNDLQDFIINKPQGRVVVQGFGNDRLDILGNFTINSGGFELLTNTPMRVDGDFAIKGGFFTFNGSSTIFRGNWNNTGGTINTGAGTVNFYPNNTTDKTIRSNGQAFNVVNFGVINDPGKGSPTPTNIASPALTKYILTDDFTAGGLTTIAARGEINGTAYTDDPAVAAANPAQPRLVEAKPGITVRLKGLRIRENGTFNVPEGTSVYIKNNVDNFSLTGSNPFPNTIPVIGIRVEGTADGFPNGKLNVIGTSDSYAKISRNDISGDYNFTVNGTISARYYFIEWMDGSGINLTASTSIAQSPGTKKGGAVVCASPSNCNNPPVACFSDGVLTNGSTVANAVYIQYTHNSAVFGNPSRSFVPDTVFNISFSKMLGVNGVNIKRTGTSCAGVPTGVLWFRDATGVMAGEGFDNDGPVCPDDNNFAYPSGQIRWRQPITRYWDGGMPNGGDPSLNIATRKLATDWNVAANWNPDGIPQADENVVLDRTYLDADYTVLINTNTGIATVRDLDIKNEDLPTSNNNKPIELKIADVNIGADLTVYGNFTVRVTPGEENLAKITMEENSEVLVAGNWDNIGRFTSGAFSTVRFGAGFKGSRVINNVAAPVPAAPDEVVPSKRAYNTFYNVQLESGTTEIVSHLLIKNDLIIFDQTVLNANAGSFPITIEGNWDNSGTFVTQRGTVTFAGDNAQTLLHTKQAENFYNLKIEKRGDPTQTKLDPWGNTVTISDSVQLEGRATVSNELSLQNGRFIAAEGKELIMLIDNIIRRPGALANTAFVKGPLGHMYSGNGSQPRSFYLGDKRFPGVAKLNLALSNPNPNGATVFTIEQIDKDPDPDYGPDDPNNPHGPSTDRKIPRPLNYVSKSRHWKVKNIAFPANGTNSDLTTGTIELPFAPEDERVDTTTANGSVSVQNKTLLQELLRAAQASIVQDSSDGQFNNTVPYNFYSQATQYKRGVAQKGTRWTDLGGIINVNENPADPDNTGLSPTITSKSFTTLGNGDFAFGFNYVPLPVEIHSFEAKESAGEVELKWITAGEKNLETFNVQRSVNGKHFVTIGTVKATGNTSNIQNYQFRDTTPVNGRNYYRLEAVDMNRESSFSKTVYATVVKSSSPMYLYPNPCNGTSFRIDVPEEIKGEVTIVVTDMTGRLVMGLKKTVPANQAIEVAPTQPLTPGLYIISLRAGGKTHQNKLSVR